MATTQLTHVIEDPAKFTRYSRQLTTVKSGLLASGVLLSTDEYNNLAAMDSATVTMPHFNPFTWVESDLINDDPNSKSVPSNITAGAQTAKKDYRAKSFSAMELTSAIIGEDVPAEIASKVAQYYTEEVQKHVLARLKGIELGNVANNAGDMIVQTANIDATGNPTDAQKVSYELMLDAFATMGDAGEKLGVIVMHSAVFYNLQKLEKTAFERPSEITPFWTFYGRPVIVSDTDLMAQGTNRKIYTTYLLGRGAFAYGETDFGRGTTIGYYDENGNGGGEERLYTRTQRLIHPLGFSCNAAITAPAKSPTLAQYSVAAAWTRVFDRKNCPIAILKTNG